jgi:hypothetical protein
VLELVRRDSGQVVLTQTFHHSSELLAESQRALATALSELSVEEFCVAYGLEGDHG